MKSPDHLNGLRAFEASARHLSFALAAQELNVTPAAIGQLIRRLEVNLGVELFHRSHSGPTRLLLTDAGRSAVPDLQAGFARLTAATDLLRASLGRQTLSVTMPMAFADKWLLHRLDRFHHRHPTCELRIDTSNALVDFSAQSVDVGIRYGAGAWPDLVSARFAHEAFFPVCSPALLDGSHPLRSPGALRDHPLIHDSSMAGVPEFPNWQAWYTRAGLPIVESERGLHVNDSAAAYRMAMAGAGVALGRTMLVIQDLAEGRLVRPFGPILECPLAYHVVCRPKDARRPMIVAFRNWLAAEAGAVGEFVESKDPVGSEEE
ncbi:MAG: transcriptional regulator GcvA [Janthinobacterium lividum]